MQHATDVLMMGLGFALLAWTTLEMAWSTVSAAGAGPVTQRVSRGLWRVFTWHAGPTHARRKAAGAGVLAGTGLFWVLMLFVGWGLIFAALPTHLYVPAETRLATLSERLYFAGFTVTTLGVGDVTPLSPLARLLTILCSASGLVLVTLTVTYLLPVVSAVTEARRLAASIHNLGTSGVAMVRDNSATAALERQLQSLESELSLYAERHLTYPVLHFFHSGARRTAVSVNIAALFDAVLLWRYALTDAERPAETVLAGLEQTLAALADTLHASFVRQSESPPPLPDAAALAAHHRGAAGPLEAAAQRLEPQRCALYATVRNSGFDWPAAAPPDQS